MQPPRDTTPAAQLAQAEAWRRLGGARRVDIALRMSDDVCVICIDGVRARHPSYTREQAFHAVLRQMLGDELYRQAWPEHELLSP